MIRLLTCAMLIACATSTLGAETRNWIYQWNYHYNIGGTAWDPEPNNPDPQYLEIVHEPGDIIIHQGIQNQPFEFEARTQEWNPETETWDDIGPGDINLIYAEENAGEVTITVLPHFGRDFGARYVRAINLGLYTQGVTGTIAALKISEDLGDPDMDAIEADVISGLVSAEGSVVNDIAIERLTGAVGCTSLMNFSAILESATGPAHTGNVTVEGPYSHTMYFGGAMEGTITIYETMAGRIEGTDDMAYIVVGEDVAGDIQIWRNLTRELSIGGDLTGSITIQRDLMQTRHIHVGGNLCDTNGDLSGGHIIVNGSFGLAADITVDGQFVGDTEFIAIDYDGWDPEDTWRTGAIVSVDGVTYDGNTPAARIWEITGCRGDMNNNRCQDTEDASAILLSEEDYAIQYPGLLGSREWHGDVNCQDGITEVDVGALAFFVETSPCCMSDCDQYDVRRADFDGNYEVNLGDLARLLASYGSAFEDPNYDAAVDIDNDGDVDLTDLAHVLGVYGGTWECPEGGGENQGMGGEGFVPEGGAPPPIQVWFEAYDTGGYSGGGFNGEVDHFVFDLKVQVNDASNDWTATGAVLQARNAATFRLSSSPTTPDAYATFVGAPWTTIPSGPGATQVIGAYEPPDPTYQFETTGINIGWYDTVDSENGPAGVIRLVIDVSAVEGADTSGGFGSVYFSTTGPANPEDILVAGVQSETGHCFGGCNMHWLNGSFYVKGQ